MVDGGDTLGEHTHTLWRILFHEAKNHKMQKTKNLPSYYYDDVGRDGQMRMCDGVRGLLIW
jgi:hypothetical protein